MGNNKGFTLVEVLIAIAMIGMVMLSFLGMYTHGHRWVFNAGTRTEELFESQDELNKALTDDTTTAVIESSSPLTMDFSQLSDTISVPGDTWIWRNDESEDVNIRAFEPD